jgi:hypothetical protein
MQPIADLTYTFTLGLRLPPHGLRPSREAVLRCAEAAAAAGIEVLHAGRFGLTARASAACIKAALGVEMPTDVNAAIRAGLPFANHQPLTSFIDRLEIAPPSISLTK